VIREQTELENVRVKRWQKVLHGWFIIGLYAIGSIRKSMVRIKFMISLISLGLLGWLVVGCTPGNPELEEAQVTKATTIMIPSTATGTSIPVVTATPQPTNVAEQGLQVFRTLLIIQANAEQLQEVARQAVENQEAEDLQASTFLIGLSTSILGVNDLLLNVQPPEGTRPSWQVGSSIQQEMITILQRWLEGEAEASQVVEMMDALIKEIDQEVSTVEGILVDELGYDQAALELERQAMLEVMQQMFGGRGE
jgi:hypothetical protein